MDRSVCHACAHGKHAYLHGGLGGLLTVVMAGVVGARADGRYDGTSSGEILSSTQRSILVFYSVELLLAVYSYGRI